MSLGGWTVNREMKKIAFRIHNESSQEISYPVCRVNAESGVLPQGSGWQPTDPRHPEDGYYQIIACPTNAQTMNVSLGLANGAWESAITLDHKDLGFSGASSFASPTEGEWSATYNAVVGRGEVAVNCNYTKSNTNWSSRMVCVTDNGKITVIPENSSSVSTLQTGGLLLVASNEFAHIKEFQLQRRKYQWAEFRNVSLQSGHRTTVEVVENLVKPVATIEPSSGATGAAPIFDTVVEQVVTNAFSFNTGGQSRVAWADGKRLEVSPGEDKEKFLREHDIDLFTDDGRGLYGIDIKVMRAEWNPQIPYERLSGHLQSSNSYTLYGLSGVCFISPGTMPAYWFETRDGLKGILQITGFTENPPGVKIRYKLVQQTWAKWNNGEDIGLFYAVAGNVAQTVAVGLNATNARIATRNNDTGYWSLETFTNYSTFFAIIYTNRQYMVAGDAGSIMTSPDGIQWTQRTTPTDRSLHSLLWDGHQYLAVGDNGTILTSPDGIAWTKRVSGSRINFKSFSYSGSRYVAVGNEGICISTDSVKWTAPATQWGRQPVLFWACTWNGAEFLVCGWGQNKFPTIYTSPDGDVWTLRDTTIKADLFAAITINGTIYVAGQNVIKKSSDGGTTWVDAFKNTTADYNQFTGLAFNGQNLIAVALNNKVWAIPISLKQY